MSLSEREKSGKTGWGRRKKGFCSGPVEFDVLVEFKHKLVQAK